MTVVARVFEPDISKWDPWCPKDVADVLSEVDAPWYVAAGWAVDLFIGRQTREHADIEIAMPQQRFDEVVDALAGFEICVITGSGEAMRLEDGQHRLEDTHQTWIRDGATGLWRCDVFREPSDDEHWIFRRDERIRLSYEQAIERTEGGVPYGSPELVLLYKAKRAHEPKHADDFDALLPLLEPERRRWLADALRMVDPGHDWVGRLEARS